MRFTEINSLLEAPNEPTKDELEGMKSVIASKIKELPPDDATAKALKEIEELLQHVNAGGRMGMIYDQLEQIKDPAVLASQKMLARYILSIDSTPEQRKEFFNIWKTNRAVNVAALLSKKKVSFSAVFSNYDSNPLVKEFVTDVMEISTLGHGRGEFGLNVLSKSIWKPEDNKGDLQMKFQGKNWQIECKTTMGGAARFSDQQVRPAEGYEAAAIELNNFVRTNKTYPVKLPTAGLSVNKAIEILQNLKSAEQTKFLNLVKNVVTLIFGGKKANQDDVKEIVTAIKAGNSGGALQGWSKASFNYYMSQKEDDGILYIDLNDKSFVFYDSAEDLIKQSLRFHASTPYLSSVKDPGRSAYPKIEVVPTSFGAETAKKTLPKFKQKADPTQFLTNLQSWASAFANRRGVKDAKTINAMAKTTAGLLQSKTTPSQIVAALEKTYPQLTATLPTQQATKPRITRPVAAPAAPRATTPRPVPGQAV
jgi:hypothetical protein